MKNIELIFAEFGDVRANAGDATFSCERLEPSLTSTYEKLVKQYDIKIKVYTDIENFDFSFDIPHSIEFRPEASTLFEEAHSRYGWRCNDYYKVLGLIESDAGVAISLDSDMFCYSDKFLDLIEITKRFGVCLPKNPRNLILVDSIIGADGVGSVEELGEGSYMMANNMSPIAFDTSNSRARTLLETYCELMLSNPKRGPHNMWRASWATGVNPLILPENWCVCENAVGIKDEIMLHVGHSSVVKHYIDVGKNDKKITKWRHKKISGRGSALQGDAVAEYIQDGGRAKRYREYDETYDSYNILFGEKITKICQSYDKKINVLDLACGTGRYFHRLKNVNELIGVDLSQSMLDEALTPTRLEQIEWWHDCQTEKNIKLVCEPVQSFVSSESRLALNDHFDFIHLIGAATEYAPPDGIQITDSLLSNIKRMLSPEGVFLFTTNRKVLTEESLKDLMDQSCMSELDIRIENVSYNSWEHNLVTVKISDGNDFP